MKHGTLRAVVHGVAASLGSGVSLLTGYYTLNLYRDAARSSGDRLTVDFLTGRITEGRPHGSTVLAARRSRDALKRLLRVAGGSKADLAEATATYFANEVFTVTITDSNGKRSSGGYLGWVGHRVLDMDQKGAIRRRPLRRG